MKIAHLNLFGHIPKHFIWKTATNILKIVKIKPSGITESLLSYPLSPLFPSSFAFLSRYMDICAGIRTSMCVQACMCVYTPHTCLYGHTRVYTCTCAYTTHVCLWVYTCIYTCMRIWTCMCFLNHLKMNFIFSLLDISEYVS